MAITEQLQELLNQNKPVYSLVLGQSGQILRFVDDQRVLVESFKNKLPFIMRIPKSGLRLMETDGVTFLETLFYEGMPLR